MNTHTHASQASAQSNETGYCLKSEGVKIHVLLSREVLSHLVIKMNKQILDLHDHYKDVLSAPLKTKHRGSLWKLDAAQKSPYFPTHQKNPRFSNVNEFETVHITTL